MEIITESAANTQVAGYRRKIEGYSVNPPKSKKRTEKYLFFLLLSAVLGGLFIGSVFFAKILLPKLSKDEFSTALNQTKLYRKPLVHKAIAILQPQIAQAQPFEKPAVSIPAPAPEPVPVFTAINLPIVTEPPPLTLTGIIYDKTAPYAIVNNQILKKGMEIQGATLVQINKESVRFRFQDKEFDIKLKW